MDRFAGMTRQFDCKQIEKMSKALGDPYRIQILEAIKKEQGWMQCNAIVEMIDLAQSTISHHVKQLVDADLLLAEKDGRHARYRINHEAFHAYVHYLNVLVQ